MTFRWRGFVKCEWVEVEWPALRRVVLGTGDAGRAVVWARSIGGVAERSIDSSVGVRYWSSFGYEQRRGRVMKVARRVFKIGAWRDSAGTGIAAGAS